MRRRKRAALWQSRSMLRPLRYRAVPAPFISKPLLGEYAGPRPGRSERGADLRGDLLFAVGAVARAQAPGGPNQRLSRRHRSLGRRLDLEHLDAGPTAPLEERRARVPCPGGGQRSSKPRGGRGEVLEIRGPLVEGEEDAACGDDARPRLAGGSRGKRRAPKDLVEAGPPVAEEVNTVRKAQSKTSTWSPEWRASRYSVMRVKASDHSSTPPVRWRPRIAATFHQSARTR